VLGSNLDPNSLRAPSPVPTSEGYASALRYTAAVLLCDIIQVEPDPLGCIVWLNEPEPLFWPAARRDESTAATTRTQGAQQENDLSPRKAIGGDGFLVGPLPGKKETGLQISQVMPREAWRMRLKSRLPGRRAPDVCRVGRMDKMSRFATRWYAACAPCLPSHQAIASPASAAETRTAGQRRQANSTWSIGQTDRGLPPGSAGTNCPGLGRKLFAYSRLNIWILKRDGTKARSRDPGQQNTGKGRGAWGVEGPPGPTMGELCSINSSQGHRERDSQIAQVPPRTSMAEAEQQSIPGRRGDSRSAEPEWTKCPDMLASTHSRG
jgi:hypothetical protein